MANEKNLIPFSERSEKEQREIRRKGGLRSGEVRRERRRLQDIVRAMLDAKSIDDPDQTVSEALVASMIESAMAGDVKAFIALRDTAGEKPVERQLAEVSGALEIAWSATEKKEE